MVKYTDHVALLDKLAQELHNQDRHEEETQLDLIALRLRQTAAIAPLMRKYIPIEELMDTLTNATDDSDILTLIRSGAMGPEDFQVPAGPGFDANGSEVH